MQFIKLVFLKAVKM